MTSAFEGLLRIVMRRSTQPSVERARRVERTIRRRTHFSAIGTQVFRRRCATGIPRAPPFVNRVWPWSDPLLARLTPTSQQEGIERERSGIDEIGDERGQPARGPQIGRIGGADEQ